MYYSCLKLYIKLLIAEMHHMSLGRVCLKSRCFLLELKTLATGEEHLTNQEYQHPRTPLHHSVRRSM